MLDTNASERLIAQMLDAKIAMDEAKAYYEELAQIARTSLPMATHRSGQSEVVIGVNRTWNKKKALESYGEAICSMQVDLDKARSVMTGEAFDAYYVDGPAKVTTRFVK